MKETIALRITSSQKKNLKELAKDMEISMSELLRRLLDQWFNEQVRKEGGR